MAERRTTAPPGMAGLVRYVEEERSLIKIKPHVFIGLCTIFLIIELLLSLGV
ncbi:MAG TPA: preprotein translocase subunit Sec61beta [Nanoarchaeota archaeon]|nr:preprotein translocase subunit Sec61beta [Nanoarchaeota archaeon]